MSTERVEYTLWGQERPRARWEEWRSLGTNPDRVIELAKREVDNYLSKYPRGRWQVRRRTIITSDWEAVAVIDSDGKVGML